MTSKRNTLMKNLLVLDGNSIINRAFYGVRGLSTANGMPTNAVFGFINIVQRYIDKLSPVYMICTFDTRCPTFRHQKFEGYKCNRKGMPDELACQMPYAKRIANALGFTVLEKEGFEADDIIGTVCREADRRGNIKSYILTGDRDSLQLITDTTNVILMRNKEDELFDNEHFFDTYGIMPSQFVDVKALMGDSSDCIPGVAGIGEKTALKLIAAAGNLDVLYENADEGYFGATPSVKRKLDEGKDSAYMSRELACICTEAPVGKDTESYVRSLEDKAELYNVFSELEFFQFIKKFGLSAPDVATDGSDNTSETTALSLNETDSTTLAEMKLDDTVTVAFNGSDIAIVSDSAVYVCKNVTEEALRAVFSHKVVCHDIKSLIKALSPYDISVDCVFDTMLARYLIDPGKNSYPISKLADSYGLNIPDSIGAEAYVTSVCTEELKSELNEHGMTGLLQDVEIPLASVLADIELTGFKVDREGIRNYAIQLLQMENELAESIYFLAGHDFNINSPKQLGVVLFEELSLPSGKKTKTGYSTDADTLKKLRFHHPIISEILSYRQVAKLRGTYGDALADLADENSRIHTSLNQCGTATGRLSSNDPNLQNIPVRGELGREIRKFFIPKNNEYVLIDADYSQIELRLLAHLSGDENMIAAFNSGTDVHTMTASQVFAVAPEEVTKELRLRAKAVNFGIIYGIGAFSLAQDIGCTRKQAEEYIASYFAAYPKVKEYLERTVEDAEKNGYTVTMFNRKRSIPELRSTNKNLAAFGKRVAMNSPIQGSAADIIKLAMINTAKALKESQIDAKLILQVHDELIVESHVSCCEKAKDILVREMENAVKLAVPLTAEAGIASSWYDAK